MGSKLVVTRSISTGPNSDELKFQNIYSVIRLREVSNQCYFSLEILKLSELQRKGAQQNTTFFARATVHFFFSTQIIYFLSAKTGLLGQSHQSLLKLDLDPIFLSQELLFQSTSRKSKHRRNVFMAGKYFGETPQPRNHIAVNTMRKSNNHTLSPH